MDNSFGDRLKKLRENRNKLQKEVALELDVSYTGYSSYENNLRMPGIKMLIKIADYYNVSTDYLLGRDEKTYLNKTHILSDIEDIENRLLKLKNKVNNSK